MRWEVIRLYRDGERLPDSEILSAVGIVGDVRMQTVMRGTKVVTEASLTGGHYPPLAEPKVVGIAPLALGIEGFEEIVRDDMTVYLRQCWLCREPR